MSDALGRQGKDVVTGFKGTITGVCHYLTGCSQYLLVPKAGKDGRSISGQWYDDQRVVVSGKPITIGGATEVVQHSRGADSTGAPHGNHEADAPNELDTAEWEGLQNDE